MSSPLSPREQADKRGSPPLPAVPILRLERVDKRDVFLLRVLRRDFVVDDLLPRPALRLALFAKRSVSTGTFFSLDACCPEKVTS